MSIEKDLKKDGIIVVAKLPNSLIKKIAKNISKRIVSTFSNFGLDEKEIFSKLSKLDMYKAQIPEGMAEASYYYKNCSIYFNCNISDEDLEEFAIHECLHYLQEKKDSKNKLKKMGLANYSSFKVTGIGLNEAAVQYLSSKVIGIQPDFEKYYDISIYTPSPSYYPIECALLNELIYFIGEDILFNSTFYSSDDFKCEIIKISSGKVYKTIESAFDNILEYEEKILKIKNAINILEDSHKVNDLNTQLLEIRKKINTTFIETQSLIIKEFFDNKYNEITNLEELEHFRKKLDKFEIYVGKTDNYSFYNNYYKETMNKLEHKYNVLENGGIETAVNKKPSSIFVFFNKLKSVFFSKKINE